MAGWGQFRRTERGFTLIETLLSLFIIMLSLPFIVFLLSYSDDSAQTDSLSVEQFFIFLRNDLYVADKIEIYANRLEFKNIHNQTVSIGKYKDLIRRQVSGEGHEIYLRNIKDLSLTENETGVIVNITTTKGSNYEKNIALDKG